MNNELQILGKQDFMGKEIPIVEGGFGEDKRCLTDKAIADIHGMTTFNIRARISGNIKRFEEDVDYIDLKVIYEINNNLELLQSLGYSKMQVSKAEHIYLLSERGYAKLIKIMDTDLAWEIHDKLVDEYFTMREIINSIEQLKARLLLAIYNGGQPSILASKRLSEIEVQEATAPLLETIEELTPKSEAYDKWYNSNRRYAVSDLAHCVEGMPIYKEGGHLINEILVEEGVLILNPDWEKSGSEQKRCMTHYLLTPQYYGKGYAYTCTGYSTSNGYGKQYKILKWSPKGIELIFDILEKRGYKVDRNTLCDELNA